MEEKIEALLICPMKKPERIFITDSLITECFNTGRSPLRKLEGDMQRKTDGCRIPVSLP